LAEQTVSRSAKSGRKMPRHPLLIAQRGSTTNSRALGQIRTCECAEWAFKQRISMGKEQLTEVSIFQGCAAFCGVSFEFSDELRWTIKFQVRHNDESRHSLVY
jgi:hypothetical protein